MASTVQADTIVNAAGSGAPGFSQGLTTSALTTIGSPSSSGEHLIQSAGGGGYTVKIQATNASAPSGQSNGLVVSAGVTSADTTFSVTNRSASANYGSCNGVGAWTLGPAVGASVTHEVRSNADTDLRIQAGAASTSTLQFHNGSGDRGSISATPGGVMTFNAIGGTVVGQRTDAGAWTLGPSSGALTHTIQSNSNTLRVQGLTSSSVVEVRSAGGSGGGMSFQDATATGDTGSLGHITSINALQARCGATGGVQLTNGATSWTAISDVNVKKNIADLSYGLSSVMELRSVFYNYNDDKDECPKRLGFIAQEVETVLPELVHSNSYGKIDGEPTLLSLDVTNMVPVLVKAIQELSAKNSDLEARLALLEAK